MKNEIAVTNSEKVLYPGGRFTKAQVVDYYRRVAKFLLPHFRNRPVTLKRFPEGVHGEFFYDKDAPSFTPSWVKTFPVPRHEGGPRINYILINDLATLLWCANIAALELHPFLHRVPKLDTPTAVVFDLDPGEGADVLSCARVALWLRDLLAQLRLKSFAKLSGSKGIQVYLPLNLPVSYEATQPFARAVAEMLEREHPELVVADMSKNLRMGKVFIDWSQNADHKMTVGVYSLRAKRNRPYVSMPVRWQELELARKKRTAEALSFTADEALKRLRKTGDLFAPVLKLKQKLPEAFAQRTQQTATKSPRALQDYNAKRNFARTDEPAPQAPRRSRQGSRRRFVVQKHAASHLHFDFRLEMHDVLKSWAVPHGVPLKLGEVHSAFKTEDHPIAYLDFEGIIPQGEYGGGTVMVWDIGTFDLVEGNYWKGALTVFLSGKKLRGEWMLTRNAEEGGKTKWLLTKTSSNARRISARQKEVSALTGRAMDEIAREKSAAWNSNRGPVTREDGRARAATRKQIAAPKFIPPMRATAVEKLPGGDDWLYK